MINPKNLSKNNRKFGILNQISRCYSLRKVTMRHQKLITQDVIYLSINEQSYLNPNQFNSHACHFDVFILKMSPRMCLKFLRDWCRFSVHLNILCVTENNNSVSVMIINKLPIIISGLL